MKEETPEKKVKSYSEQIRKEISHWKDINQNGCNDPFWPGWLQHESDAESYPILSEKNRRNLYRKASAISGRILFFTSTES